MNGIEALFLTDAQAETEGKWFVLEGTDMEFRIARFGNERAKAARNRIKDEVRQEQHLRADQEVELTDEHWARAMAEGILRDWRNVPDPESPDGQLAYSEAVAARMLAMKDFSGWVSMHAADLENYRVASLAQRAEILGKGSPGK